MSLPNFPWDRLLDLVEERRVIPVVGSDLLVVQDNGTQTTLEAHCASQLAGRLGLVGSGDAGIRSLNQLAVARAAGRGRVGGLQEAAFELKEDLEKLPVPGSLLSLASLPLSLFLTTTFDPLLRRAIDQVRFAQRPKTRVLAYYPGDRVDDLPDRLEDLQGPTVFHLFGRLQPLPFFAVTDEDVLECVLALQALSLRDDKGRLRNLFDALSRSSLLLLGTSFSDWLARFFLRVAAQERLSSAPRFDFITDTLLERDQGLVLFLQHFASGARVFLEGSPADFVRQLAERWAQRHPDAAEATRPDTAAPIPRERGAVFLSYAREDRPAVQVLYEAMEAAGIDVWFDRQELGAGDRWKELIRRNIEDSSCFVAVLSRHCLTSQRREFRSEWSVAVNEQNKARGDLPFIVPVVIDDVPIEDPGLDAFRLMHQDRAPNGRPSPALLDKVQGLVRTHHLSRGGQG